MRYPSSKRKMHGLSIVELLVAIVVGLITTVAIMHSYSMFEGRKRTASSGSDAQINGSFAAYSLERELRVAGYTFAAGTADTSPVGCLLSGGFANFPSTPNNANAPVALTRMMPVTLVDGGGTNSDIVRVMSGDAATVVPYEAQPVGAQVQVTARGMGINRDNFLLQFNTASNDCAIRRVTQISDSGGNTWITGAPAPAGDMPATVVDPVRLDVANSGTGVGFNNTGLSPNLASFDYVLLLGNLSVSTFSTIANVGANAAGPQPRNSLNQYTVMTGQAAQQFEVAPDIVNIQAQYGLDNVSDNATVVTNWVDPTLANGYDVATLQGNGALASRIKAVRVAVIARSALLEKPLGAGTCTAPLANIVMSGFTLTTTGNLQFTWPDGTAGQANVVPSAPTNWACYRYQAFTTTVPLRSVIWSSVK